jgi:hypothetical protein
LWSAEAEGDSGYQAGPKGLLEAIKDVLAMIANDVTKPGRAVHGDEEGAVAEAGGVGVGGDVRINEMGPGFEEFGGGLMAIQA